MTITAASVVSASETPTEETFLKTAFRPLIATEAGWAATFPASDPIQLSWPQGLDRT
jgi:hypothetical protein